MNSFHPISRFHTAQESGLDVGKNVKMTVSANQSCPFGYLSLHRPRLPYILRGMKSGNENLVTYEEIVQYGHLL